MNAFNIKDQLDTVSCDSCSGDSGDEGPLYKFDGRHLCGECLKDHEIDNESQTMTNEERNA